jgi:hypothetical protein
MTIHIPIDQQIIAGFIVGAFIIAALWQSAAFRKRFLFCVASLILYVYIRSGIGGLQKLYAVIATDAIRHKSFSWGALTGIFIVASILVINRSRSRGRS